MLTPSRQPGPISLRALIPSASFVGCADIAVSAVTEQSSECTPGCLFAALPGFRSHGRQHIDHALLGGAAAILTDRPLAHVSLPQCVVPDVRHAYGLVCHGLYGCPSRKLGVAAVTGTNGKTTVTWLVRSLLESASRPTGVIGTIEYNDSLQSQPSSLTTPDALTLARCLAAIQDRRAKYAAVELSSHALKQDRASGLMVDVAIVTNVTSDHLDYHGSTDDYFRSKARIAELVKRGGLLVLNADDPCHAVILQHAPADCRVLTFGCETDADITARIETMSSQGTKFRLTHGVEQVDCWTPLIGKHNVSNCLAAVSAVRHFGLSLDEIATGLAQFDHVPGRLEQVDCGQEFQVYVDYAHTEDALKHAIATVRTVTTGRVIVVFGAGGDRDRTKRPQMARAAASADEVIVTSDNPRSEDPKQILLEVCAGFQLSECSYTSLLDRRQAIEHALDIARSGDAVLIAGKGHEKTQQIGAEKIPFDDVAVCRDWIRANLSARRTSETLASH